MNKKGQTLILFVILIPILLGVAAFVIDTGYIVCKSTKLKEVTKNILDMNISTIDDIKKNYEENGIPVDNLDVLVSDNEVHIENEYFIDSIFGAVIGIDEYKIKVDMTGILE